MSTDLQRLLADRYPDLPDLVLLLDKIQKRVKLIKQENGGYLEMTIHMNKGIFKWVDYGDRELLDRA